MPASEMLALVRHVSGAMMKKRPRSRGLSSAIRWRTNRRSDHAPSAAWAVDATAINSASATNMPGDCRTAAPIHTFSMQEPAKIQGSTRGPPMIAAAMAMPAGGKIAVA